MIDKLTITIVRVENLILLTQHSSLMNYTNEYTIKLLVHYKLSCNSSVGYEESEITTVTVKLRPLGKFFLFINKEF